MDFRQCCCYSSITKANLTVFKIQYPTSSKAITIRKRPHYFYYFLSASIVVASIESSFAIANTSTFTAVEP